MAEQFSQLEASHTQFIQQQHIFFVGTAGAQGTVNVSPKGMDSLRVLNSHSVAWLNLTGSGNESSAHVLENGRMTIMFCSFGRQPMIMRLYGAAKVIHPRDEQWQELLQLFPAMAGARQIFVLDIEMVQTSCGYAVPHYEYQSDRQTLVNWAEKRSPEGIEEYWQEKNTKSLDGRDTGIF